MTHILYSVIERNGFCRCCDKMLFRSVDKVVKFYSRRNCGQHIILCKACIQKLNDIVKED